MRRVEVEWLDSMTLDHGGWGDIEDFGEATSVEAMTHRSCGYLISETEEAILLAQSLYAQHGVQERAAGALVIPRRAVLSLKDLDAGEKYRGARDRRPVTPERAREAVEKVSARPDDSERS